MKKLLLIAAAVLLAPGIAAAADISGAWKITTNANGQDLVVNCNFAQSGSALSGTCGLAGGAGLVVAKKAGLLAVALLFFKKGFVVIAAAAAGMWAWLKRVFGGKKSA